MTERFQNTNEHLSDFLNDALVVCPQCRACARIVAIGGEERRFSCFACGLTRPNVTTDGFAFWLEMPCCGERLWAANRALLELLEQYIKAKLRERNPSARSQRESQGLVSRLPQWMQSAKNRDEIIKSIDKLKAKLPR